MTVPLDASISLTVPTYSFVTQTWVPSEDTPSGVAADGDRGDDGAARRFDLTDRIFAVVRDPDVGSIRRHAIGAEPTWIVRMTVPLDASISLTVASGKFVTQTWVPSEDTPKGSLPTGIVRMTVPLDASISLTVSSFAVRDPDVGSIRRHAQGAAADGDRADDGAARRFDLTDRIFAGS